ncbi:MAG: sugar phosphate isomerase/epimerase [Clostridiales bacterium]|nr:sugar phosphate isomerase/epimerase [Clostridiales bacterium]
MLLAVSTYSYTKAIKAGNITWTDIPALAKKAGFDGVDFSSAPEMWPYLDTMKKQLADLGLTACHYSTGLDLLAPDAKERIDNVKRELDRAKELGVPVFRHDVSSGFPKDYSGPRSYDAALPILAEGCKEITEYAKTLGIKTCTENHGHFSQDSERVEKLICTVNDENFGALVDFGNFMCADEDPLSAVARMSQYAFHAHAKDFHYKKATERRPEAGWFDTRRGDHIRGAIIGHGVVPVFECIKLMDKAGYNGYLSLEFEGMEEPVYACELGYAQLKKYLTELEIYG